MSMMDIVRSLEGKSDGQRRLYIEAYLKKKKISYKKQKYESGTNIIVPGGDFILATHFDTVPESPGANDCASGCAVLLKLCEHFKGRKKRPEIIFFDEEENYCNGSFAYMRKKPKHVKGMLTLELVGTGNLVAIWPVIEEFPLVKQVRLALKTAKIKCEEAGKLPMFWADYLPFKEAGIDALTLSIVPSKDKEKIRSLATSPLWQLPFRTLLLPKFFKRYHSKGDVSEHLSEKAMLLCKKALMVITKKVL